MSEVERIMREVLDGKMSKEDGTAMIQKLLENKPKHSWKVSEKGAISFYGLRRMPITLYKTEVETLQNIFSSEEFEQFVSDNKGKLATKPSKE